MSDEFKIAEGNISSQWGFVYAIKDSDDDNQDHVVIEVPNSVRGVQIRLRAIRRFKNSAVSDREILFVFNIDKLDELITVLTYVKEQSKSG